MEENEFKEKMQEKSKILGFDFSVEQISKFYKYMNMLIEWNEKINLTAIIEPNEIILKHFIDSLTIYKDIPNKSSVVDVGTGAGFPGIPLAIMNESLKVTLVDSLNKRLIFLQEVINELNLIENNLYKIILIGKRNFIIDSQKIIKLINKKNILKIKDFTKIKYNLEEISKQQSLKGIFVKKCLEEMQNTENKEIIENAIEYGLEALEG